MLENKLWDLHGNMLVTMRGPSTDIKTVYKEDRLWYKHFLLT